MVTNRINKSDLLGSIQPEMQQVEALMRRQADGYHPELAAALQHLLSSGGKRVRPAITLLLGRMLGADRERLITLAAAIELLHTATLVHDDLIDGAILRRGIATLNAQWSPAATVLTGDFIFAQAAGLAADTYSVPVIKLFAETLSTIVAGEITQLFAGRKLLTNAEYQQRIYSKTASLFVLATTSPALLSKKDERCVENARQFGRSIGMAFQIVDDVLDFTGEQATVGKPVASDLRQGLVTLPTLYYAEKYPEDADLKAVLNGKYPGEDLILRLVVRIRDSGAIERSMKDAHHFVDQGLEYLNELPDGLQRTTVERLSRYFVEREL